MASAEALRSVLDMDMEEPADDKGLFLLKILAADFVGTAPCRLFRRTLCILPGTEGHEATPRRLSAWVPGVWNLL